ncbi:MAG: beta-lactamase family protein [Gemmatimonadaceae bacterium]|nr:beta-lactamase family protein [Gemmatimonadaceae bacterium]
MKATPPRPHQRPSRPVPQCLGALAVTLSIVSGLQAQGAAPRGTPERRRQAPTAEQADIAGRLRMMARTLARQDRFSGVVLLTRDGRPVLEQAYGFADREARRPMTVGTIMNVSSVGKLFTQVAIGQLAAAGRLSPDSTIAAYWPDYPDAAVARKVTIRHLLTHRSGINGNIFENLPAMRRNRDYLPAATRGPLAFEPGSRAEYSNAGYVILGEIIERVSGEVYHEYIQRHVFAPAAMTVSAFPARDSLPPRAAIGYTRGADDAPTARLVRATGVQPIRGSAAGGAFASAGDLLRFVMARRRGQLGVPARLLSDQSAGGSPGSNVVISEGLPAGYHLIVLANVDPPIAEMMADSVERWLGGGERVGGPPQGPGRGPRIVLRGSPDDADDGPQGPLLDALPETPRGRAAAAYLRAFSSGDSALMRTVIETLVVKDERTTDDRVRRYLEIFADNGPLTILGVREAPDSSLAIEVRSEKNGEMMVGVSFVPDGSARIAGVRFEVRRR